jgi:ribosomal protein L22
MVLKKLQKIVLKIKFVEQTNNMIIDKTNVFVKKDLLNIKDNADNAQLDQLLLMVTHVFVIQIIKYMMKNQINARRDVYKINSGY